jgi:hypothetical protein
MNVQTSGRGWSLRSGMQSHVATLASSDDLGHLLVGGEGYARRMSDEERRPIPEVLPGQVINPLPEGWTPMEVFVLIKCMDEGGDSAWSFRTTNPLNLEEQLGRLPSRWRPSSAS